MGNKLYISKLETVDEEGIKIVSDKAITIQAKEDVTIDS